MTNDEIENMPTGSELDALIAELVMGEPKPPTLQHDFHLNPTNSDKDNWYCQPEYDTGDVCSWTPYHFSSNPTAAKRVLLEMDKWWETRGVCFELGNARTNTNARWWANIIHSGSSHSTNVVWADTLELAICRSALWELKNGSENPSGHW